MVYPVDGPATVAAVKAHLQLTTADQDVKLTSIVAAVNSRVLSWPVATVADGAADWDGPHLAHLVEGAVMLAGRLFRRRNSPDGVSAFGTLGPVYVQRNDPDVALLLQLGAYAKPAVG